MDQNIGYGSAKREAALDILKLIAAFLVVFYHYAYYKLDFGFTPGQVYVPNLNRIIMSFAACSVPLFFTINGILLFRRHRHWKELCSKAAKILVLILVWSFADFPVWFFRTLMILYLLFPVLQYLRDRHPRLLAALCGCVFLMPFGYNLALMCLKGLALAGILPDWTAGLTVTGAATLYSILYFCMGQYLMKLEKWPLRRSVVCIISGWVLVLAECAIYTNGYQEMWDAVNSAFPTAGALLMAVGMLMAFRNIRFAEPPKLVTWFSEGVLAVYLMHMFWVRLFERLLGNGQIGLLQGLAVSACIFGLCVLIQKIAKQIPGIRWLFKI